MHPRVLYHVRHRFAVALMRRDRTVSQTEAVRRACDLSAAAIESAVRQACAGVEVVAVPPGDDWVRENEAAVDGAVQILLDMP